MLNSANKFVVRGMFLGLLFNQVLFDSRNSGGMSNRIAIDWVTLYAIFCVCGL